MKDLILEEGKYTVRQKNEHVDVLRNGRPWRNVTSDKLVVSLIDRVRELESAAKNLEGTISEYLLTPCPSLRDRMRNARDRYEKIIYKS